MSDITLEEAIKNFKVFHEDTLDISETDALVLSAAEKWDRYMKARVVIESAFNERRDYSDKESALVDESIEDYVGALPSYRKAQEDKRDG